ncbi:MAG: hypothetical protein KDC39_01760 [Actinobacteria bacterium]|nr:hypothetical protein [Actinomycetota bacterium]
MNERNIMDQQLETGHGPNRSGRIGRAAAWFAAGALGATALTGVAFANVTAQDNNDDNQTESEEMGPGIGPRGGPGHHHGPGGPGGGMGGPMLHGEGVVQTPDGEYQDVVTQQGSVTEINDNSIVVTSEDGFTASYKVNDDTEIHKNREEVSISDLATGDVVHVFAQKKGGNVVAQRIGAMTAEQAAEMEQRREEMRQQFEQRREEQQQDSGGDTSESGWRGWQGSGGTSEAGFTI